MNIGIVGTSTIVPWFTESLKDYASVKTTALYSRSYEKGKDFAENNNIEKVYTDLEEMCSDPDIDTIYIVSPNVLHYPQAKTAILHGKNVIVEKPFCAALKQAEELFRLAEEKNVKLFDMSLSREYSRFLLIEEYRDRLGKIRLYKDNRSQYSRRYDAFLAGQTPNVFSPEMEGGALMDLNVYNIALMVMLFGRPDEVYYMANTERGIDTGGELILKYPELICESSSSKCSAGRNIILVQGEKGYLTIDRGFNPPAGSTYLQLNGKDREEINPLFVQQDMSRIVRCLQENDSAVYEQEKERILTIVEILEKARRCAGLIFPGDRN